MEDSFPDIDSMSDEEPRALIAGLAREERGVFLPSKVPDADEAR